MPTNFSLVDKLDKYFLNIHENQGFKGFVISLQEEVQDIAAFINSLNEEEVLMLFRLMVKIYSRGDNEATIYAS